MLTTVTLDHDLLEKARLYTGIQETSALIQQALLNLAQKEVAKRLAELDGSASTLKPVRRRQTQTSDDPD
ncbi:Antitoxin VapB32 [compost metagenome]